MKKKVDSPRLWHHFIDKQENGSLRGQVDAFADDPHKLGSCDVGRNLRGSIVIDLSFKRSIYIDPYLPSIFACQFSRFASLLLSGQLQGYGQGTFGESYCSLAGADLK